MPEIRRLVGSGWLPPRAVLTPDPGVHTVNTTMTVTPEAALGWTPQLDEAWSALDRSGVPGRAMRLDRGWTTVLQVIGEDPIRVRNIGADVAVGDWVIPSDDGEKVETVIER